MDLAGRVYRRPHYGQTRHRINRLVDRYLSAQFLSERLSDITTQFVNPHARPWDRIDWSQISPDQIVGVTPNRFIQVIAAAAEIEDPIRAYSQESFGYLQPIHPQMARFMGGVFTPEGQVVELGVWEKEERQHGPAFRKIYQKLTGEKLEVKPNSVTGYQPSTDPYQDAHRHIHSRISTEWGALSIYLWLAAHATGELQQALVQPLQDEINHLAKFWGLSRWAFNNGYVGQVRGSIRSLLYLTQHHKEERSNSQELLHLDPEQVQMSLEIAFTLTRVMVRLRTWNRELSPSYLRHLFGRSPVTATIAA
jgi:hypothetical protein